MKKIYGTFGVEMRAYGQKLFKLCTHTHTHTRVSYSSIDTPNSPPLANTGVVERGVGSTTGDMSVYPPVWDLLLPLA